MYMYKYTYIALLLAIRDSTLATRKYGYLSNHRASTVIVGSFLCLLMILFLMANNPDIDIQRQKREYNTTDNYIRNFNCLI